MAAQHYPKTINLALDESSLDTLWGLLAFAVANVTKVKDGKLTQDYIDLLKLQAQLRGLGHPFEGISVTAAEILEAWENR